MLKKLSLLSLFGLAGMLVLSAFLMKFMPSELPLIRSSQVEKNLFWAIRIPAINLLSYLVISLFWRAVLRREEFHTCAEGAGALMLTVLTKGGIEFLSLFSPSILRASIYLLPPVLLLGLGWAALSFRPLFKGEAWKRVVFTKAERLLLLGGLAGYILLLAPALIVAARQS